MTSTLDFLAGDGGAFGVNDSGEIVGAGNDAALYWENRDAAPLVLPTPQGSTRSFAEAINNDGLICGWSTFVNANGQFVTSAVVWRVHVELVNDQPTRTIFGPLLLPALTAGDSAQARAINDNSQEGIALVVGSEWEVGTGNSIAALAWAVTSLPNGTLAVGLPPEVFNLPGHAYGVNNSGVACGDIWPEAVIWSGDTTRILDRSATISVFGGRKKCNSAVAHAINAGGVAVGYGNFGGGYTKAVVWPNTSGPMIVLDKFIKGLPISELSTAYDVNDSGEIVGHGWDNERSLHMGYLAIPK